MRKGEKGGSAGGGLGTRTPCLGVLVKGYSDSARGHVPFSTGSYELPPLDGGTVLEFGLSERIVGKPSI
jgi:hypothetical protein